MGRGSETVQAGNLVTDGDYLLVLLLDSHYCSQSRELVRTLSERHDGFRRRETTVVPVLPDIRERARVWDRQYELPFPMLADPADRGARRDGAGPGGEERFGAFERLREPVGELPAVALCRPCEDGLTVVATATEAALDVPVVESLLGFIDRHQATDAAPTGNTLADS